MKKRTILMTALVPLQIVILFFCVEQLTHSQKDAWCVVGISGGLWIVVRLTIALGQKLNQRNEDTAKRDVQIQIVKDAKNK